MAFFSLSPIFLLSLVGWVNIRKWPHFRPRVFLWLGLLLTVSVIGFYLSRTQNYNYGGNTAGLRWTFWLIPFWLLATIPVVDQWGSLRCFRAIASVLLAISIYSVMSPLPNPWQHPWVFSLMKEEGWIDYSNPPAKFERPLTTWFRSIPNSDVSNRPEWIEFSGPGEDGVLMRLRFTRRRTCGTGRKRASPDRSLPKPGEDARNQDRLHRGRRIVFGRRTSVGVPSLAELSPQSHRARDCVSFLPGIAPISAVWSRKDQVPADTLATRGVALPAGRLTSSLPTARQQAGVLVPPRPVAV